MKNHKITLEWLESKQACSNGIIWFKKQTETDGILILEQLIKEEKWDWFRWLAARMMTHDQKVEWAIFCAEQVIDIFEKKYPQDKRPRLAIEASKRWLKDKSEINKDAANAAAHAVADAAYADAANAAHAANADAHAAAHAANADAHAAYAAYAANAADVAGVAGDADRTKMRALCSNEAMRILVNKTR